MRKAPASAWGDSAIKGGERVIMLNQALARLLDALHQGVVGGVVAAQLGQIGFDRRGSMCADQAADVLGLALERAIGG